MNATEFVEKYLDAWNKQDSRAIANTLSESGTYRDTADRQQMSRQQLIAHLDSVFEHETYAYELAGDVCVGDNTVAFQYKAFPRDAAGTADLSAPWFGAEFMTLRGDSADEIVDYYEKPGLTTPQSRLPDVAGIASVQRYAKSGLSTAQMGDLKLQLRKLMDDEKVYLRSDLALPDLAKILNCSVNHLSQVINAGFGVSFFDFLNNYRIDEATCLLGLRQDSAGTVLSLALEVGFNSTSTFYVAFKKVTGKTPAQYRKGLGLRS